MKLDSVESISQSTVGVKKVLAHLYHVIKSVNTGMPMEQSNQQQEIPFFWFFRIAILIG